MNLKIGTWYKRKRNISIPLPIWDYDRQTRNWNSLDSPVHFTYCLFLEEILEDSSKIGKFLTDSGNITYYYLGSIELAECQK